MDIKTLNDGQKQNFQRLLDKLIARNKFTVNEAENFRSLLENVRDSKNLQFIMEKLKDNGCFDLEKIEDNLKEGEHVTSFHFLI